MRISNDDGWIRVRPTVSKKDVFVLLADEDGMSSLILTVDQCNAVIAAMIEARNAVSSFQNKEFGDE